jgi:hypothetical protein
MSAIYSLRTAMAHALGVVAMALAPRSACGGKRCPLGGGIRYSGNSYLRSLPPDAVIIGTHGVQTVADLLRQVSLEAPSASAPKDGSRSAWLFRRLFQRSDR